MIPKRSRADKVQLRQQARDDAYKRMWYDIYRHKMRYDVRDPKVITELDLDDKDVLEIEKYYNQTEQAELPVKFVTIGLPLDHDPEVSKNCLDRCLKKCYVGEWAYAYELGKDQGHPHYHVYFTQTVKWLAKSRIIDEWSRVFDIEKNFIDVESTSSAQIPNLDKYIKKENIVYQKKKKNNVGN